VLTSVEFDDQVPRKAHEVGDVASDGNLTSETVAQEASIAKELPKRRFVRSLIAPQSTSERLEAWWLPILDHR
jgi:hypothetical protein